MEKPIFVNFPSMNGSHVVRVDRIIHMKPNRNENRETEVIIERWEAGLLSAISLYSPATVAEIEAIIKTALL